MSCRLGWVFQKTGHTLRNLPCSFISRLSKCWLPQHLLCRVRLVSHKLGPRVHTAGQGPSCIHRHTCGELPNDTPGPDTLLFCPHSALCSLNIWSSKIVTSGVPETTIKLRFYFFVPNAEDFTWEFSPLRQGPLALPDMRLIEMDLSSATQHLPARGTGHGPLETVSSGSRPSWNLRTRSQVNEEGRNPNADLGKLW